MILKKINEILGFDNKFVFLSVISLLVILICFQLIVIPIYTYFILPKYAKFKIKDEQNLIVGCAYYSGKYKTKSGNFIYEFRVDDTFMNSFDGSSIDFPFRAKRRDFFHILESTTNQCTKVKYISIDYIVLKKNYIYDALY